MQDPGKVNRFGMESFKRDRMSRRKICVVTGTRAEYGLLSGLMQAVKDDPELELQLIVTGAHLSPLFAMTVREIEADGFAVDARVDIELDGTTTARSTSRSFALCVTGMSEALSRLEPDIVVLLGDRYEALATGIASMIARIPIAHIHGGEATEGLVDEAMRHALTKMAHLHFATAAPYARRILQLGEQPDRIFVVGAPGLDHARVSALMSREEWEKTFQFRLEPPVFLVTYHPVTLSERDPGEAVQSLLDALSHFPNARIVLTGVNADTGSHAIRFRLEKFVSENSERVLYREALGQRGYLSAMRLATAVVGNSTSGIIEAPFFRVPAVNIGDRQRGRLKAASVIDCEENEAAIRSALERAMDANFRSSLPSDCSLYGHGNAASRIKEVLKSSTLNGIVLKRFYDLPSAGHPLGKPLS